MTYPPRHRQRGTVEAWRDKEAGVGSKVDSEEDLAGVDEGNQEELGLDEDQHHPAPPKLDSAGLLDMIISCSKQLVMQPKQL